MINNFSRFNWELIWKQTHIDRLFENSLFNSSSPCMHACIVFYVRWSRCMQRGHGRQGTGDVDEVQHQRDGTPREEGEGEEVGRLACVVPRGAGGWMGGRVRGGADSGHRERGGAPGPPLRPSPFPLPPLPFPEGPTPAFLSVSPALIATTKHCRVLRCISNTT